MAPNPNNNPLIALITDHQEYRGWNYIELSFFLSMEWMVDADWVVGADFVTVPPPYIDIWSSAAGNTGLLRLLSLYYNRESPSLLPAFSLSRSHMLVSPEVRVLDLEWTFTRNTPIWEMPCNVIPCQFVWFPEGRPHLYRDEMAVFIWDEFEVLVTTWSTCRALKYEGWSKKVSNQKARERNVNFRDAYFRLFRTFPLIILSMWTKLDAINE